MPRAGLTPEAVVDGAAELADEAGHEQLTLAALAARFGVAVPSLYKHVGGLADLQRRLAIRAVDEMGCRLADAVDGREGAEAFAAMARAYRGYAREHPGRYAATVRAPDPDDAEHLAASDAVLGTVLEVLGSYGLDGDDAVDAARMVRAGLHGFASLEAAGGFGLPREVERSFERLVDGLEHALAHWRG